MAYLDDTLPGNTPQFDNIPKFQSTDNDWCNIGSDNHMELTRAVYRQDDEQEEYNSESVYRSGQDDGDSAMDKYPEEVIPDGQRSPSVLFKHNGFKISCIFCTASILVLTVVPLVISLLGAYSMFWHKPSPVIDLSVNAFATPNHIASRQYHALRQAQSNRDSAFIKNKFRQKRSVDTSMNFHNFENDQISSLTSDSAKRPSSGSYDPRLPMSTSERLARYFPSADANIRQRHIRWKLQLIYLADGGSNDDDDNIFTQERLEAIHRIERRIVSHPKYEQFCWHDRRIAYTKCAPLTSMLTYFYPSEIDGRLVYDGHGKNLTNITRSLERAMSSDSFYFFVDDKINSKNKKSRLLRTVVLFGVPLPGYLYASSHDHRSEESDLYQEFITSYIPLLDSLSTDKVRVLYGGHEIFDYEVNTSFWHDIELAKYTLIFIAVFVLILTSFSFFLTFWGLLSILLSFPFALFFYKVVFGIHAFGILNGAAACLIIGIGVDDVFVFVNTFHQAVDIADIRKRLAYTIKTAGKATLFTSATTSAAFAANTASSIPALYEFGVFMSLIVCACWVTVVLLMPAALYIWYILFAWLHATVYAFFKRIALSLCGKPSGTESLETLLDDMRNPTELHLGPYSSLFGNSGDDDDMLILQLQDQQSDGSSHDSYINDVPMLTPEGYSSHMGDASKTEDKIHGSAFSVGHYIQEFLYKYLTRLIVAGRWFIGVKYLLILATSIYLITNIQLASKPPQLFNTDTNLQQMLDLKANLSIDDVPCYTCSGYLQLNRKKTKLPLPSNTKSSHTDDDKFFIPPELARKLPPGLLQNFSKEAVQLYIRTHPELLNGAREIVHDADMPNDVRSHINVPGSESGDVTTEERPLPTEAVDPAFSLRPQTKMKDSAHRGTSKSGHNQFPQSDLIPPWVYSRTTPSHPSTAASANQESSTTADSEAAERPVMETGAMVYVVFGIKDLDRSNVSREHVISNKYGEVIYDTRLSNYTGMLPDDMTLRELCAVCHLIANNTELVKPGSAQCMPTGYPELNVYIQQFSECQNLPGNLEIFDRQAPVHADAGMDDRHHIKWIAFAFESTTAKGESYFEAYHDYHQWENFMKTIREEHLRADSPLQSIFQTSQFWTKVVMEVVCVNSAVYGIALSLFICVIAVAIFTGHVILVVIILMTIGGIISLDVAIFYLAGWEIGAVEAVSLSILVGSSVDYCVHIVEGYLIAGNSQKLQQMEGSSSMIRQWRVGYSVHHIGVSIISSALTTIIAAIPLTQAIIHPFSRFGMIILINTSISILYALVVCTALLTIMGPARFRHTLKTCGISVLVTSMCVGVFVLALYVSSRLGAFIPNPNGGPLFPN